MTMRAALLIVAGLICLGGMLVFDWTALTMLVFMIADAQVTVIAWKAFVTVSIWLSVNVSISSSESTGEKP